MTADQFYIIFLLAFCTIAAAFFLAIYLWMYRRQKRLPDNWRRKEMNENLAVLSGVASLVALVLNCAFIYLFWLFLIFFPALLLLLLATGYHWRLARKLSRALAGSPEAVDAQKAHDRSMILPSVAAFVLMTFLFTGALSNGLPALALLFAAFAAGFLWLAYYYRRRSK